MADYDIIDIGEAMDVLNVPDADAAKLQPWISTVSAAIDYWCGPVIKRSADVTETHDGGTSVIRLDHWPVVSITSVTDYGTTCIQETDAESPPSEGYLLERYTETPELELWGPKLIRRTAGRTTRWYSEQRAVSVVYRPGRFEDLEAVDYRFRGAAIVTLQNFWRSSQVAVQEFGEYQLPSQSFAKFGLPNAAKDLLGTELQRDPTRLMGFA